MDAEKPDYTIVLPPRRVLILEDNKLDAKLMVALLESGGCKVQATVLDLPESFQEHLEIAEYDVILSNFHLGIWTVLDALGILKRSGKDIPLIIVTGNLGDEVAAECIKQGAADIVLKDRPERLPQAVQRALEDKRLRAEKKRALETISRLAAIVESSDDAIVGKTLEGIITSWNKGAEKLYGYSAAEVLGQPISALAPPDLAEEEAQILARVERGKRIEHYESVRVRKDGSLVDVSLSIFPLTNSDGEVIGIASIARDIAERKRFEIDLKGKNTELENANRAKDHFLALMSHELRTPLNAILGFTGTLLMKLPGPLTEEQVRQLRTIQSSGKLLLSLISDLLDLAKIESGKVAIFWEHIILQSVVEEVRATLTPLAEKKGLKMTVHVPEEELVLTTDRRSLTQILLNLTGNAIKFTEKGGVDIELRGDRHNGHRLTEITVRDTGVGIPDKDQAKLFQAFTQVGNTGPRRHEGTGLGLHLSRKLAELLGGQIRFHSQYGKGSTFTLSLQGK
jgi:protein-histidine pros-kinase